MTRPELLDHIDCCRTATLREELNARGYTDHASALYPQRRVIRRGAKFVAALDADACWRWLARLDSKCRAIAARRAV